MAQDYLVLDGVYYWHYEETPRDKMSARYRLFELRKEGKDVVLLTVPVKQGQFGGYKYHIYERDPDGEGPEEE